MARTVRLSLAGLVLVLSTSCLKLNPDFEDPTEHATQPCSDAAVPALDCSEAGDCPSWCDPNTWGGNLPDSTTDVVIPPGRIVTLDCDGAARTVEIAAGGGLRAARDRSSQLLVHGNLIVRGRLDYGAFDDRVRADVTAEIVFTGMDDGAVVGTPDDAEIDAASPPIEATDVGMWVVDDGIVTAAGQRKRAWTRLAADAARGERRLVVEEAWGWRAGDRIFVTPTSPNGITSYDDFDDSVIAEVSDTELTLAESLGYEHHGCVECLRRAEVGNLSRNVSIRSLDTSAHAHVFVAGNGVLQLDSVELRWLGPEPRCGDEDDPPAERRAPIYFYRQDRASERSFVCHTAVWGGGSGGYVQEASHGVHVEEVVSYDASGAAFRLLEGSSGQAPRDTVFTRVLAARVGIPRRPSDCNRISHNFSAFRIEAGDRSGCAQCVAAGVGRSGSGNALAGFRLVALDAREITFRDNVAHHVRGHGVFMRETSCRPREVYGPLALWTLSDAGFSWERSGCQSFSEVSIADAASFSLEYRGEPADDRARMAHLRLDDLVFRGPSRPALARPSIFGDLSFSGARPLAITQSQETCGGADEVDPVPEQFDPESSESGCIPYWIHLENIEIPPEVERPLWFGWPGNFHTRWTVVGFEHPAHPAVPASFTLYRRDNEVEGGCYHEGFDAWLVPGNGGSSCN
jgi:hypothetical protein